MLAHAFALILVAQVAADGLTINPNIPDDLVTWRWAVVDGQAKLGWGKLNAAGNFVAVSPAPEVPCFPALKHATASGANTPNDSPAWRWVRYDGEACLVWGTIDSKGQIAPVHPRPYWPLLVDNPFDNPAAKMEVIPMPTPKPRLTPELNKPTPKPASVGDMPAFAVNGVAAEKMDGKGLTLRASDRATADKARETLYESDMGEPIEGIKLPKFCPSIGPDLSEFALYAIAFGLFGVAGVVFLRSLQPR